MAGDGSRRALKEILTGSGVAELVVDVVVLLVLDSVVLVGVAAAVGSVPVLLDRALDQ